MGMNWRNNIKQSSGKIPKLLQALFKKFNFRTLTPVAESNFLEKKGLDSWNFFSKFRVLETFSNNVKVNPVVSWNGHNSFQRIQFFSISAFYYTSASGAFPFMFLFRKEPFKYGEKYWLTKDCSGGFMNPLYSPRNEHNKTEFSKKNSEQKLRRIGNFCREQIWSYDRCKDNMFLKPDSQATWFRVSVWIPGRKEKKRKKREKLGEGCLRSMSAALPSPKTVKRLLAKWIGTQKRLFSVFLAPLVGF